jgi:hypothetical protein
MGRSLGLRRLTHDPPRCSRNVENRAKGRRRRTVQLVPPTLGLPVGHGGSACISTARPTRRSPCRAPFLHLSQVSAEFSAYWAHSVLFLHDECRRRFQDIECVWIASGRPQGASASASASKSQPKKAAARGEVRTARVGFRRRERSLLNEPDADATTRPSRGRSHSMSFAGDRPAR